VRVAFSAKWLDVVPVVPPICLYALFVSISFNIGDLYKALGRPDILTRLAAVRLALAVPALWSIAPAAEAAKRCTRTIRGTRTGVLTVAAGERVCLKNAVQNGNVSVAPDGSLTVVDSRIVGTVTLDSGFRKFKFCHSRTSNGAITATGGTGDVNIGRGSECAGNVIDGALVLDANASGVWVNRSHIAGATTVSNTIGRTVLSGNRMAGALTCATNNPDPVNGGNPNRVNGARTGETCANPNF